MGLKWNNVVSSSGWHEDSVPIPSVSEPQAGAQTSQDDRDITAALERRPRPQEEALGGGAALHLVQPAVLDSHCREALGPAVGGTLLAGRTGYSQTPRQSLQGVLRAPGGISKVQEVLLVWLVHLSPGVQRFSEAGCDPEETLPLEGRERQGRVSQADAPTREAEDLHRCKGTERQVARLSGV